ncbi:MULTISPECIES: tRNA1(Val) (adenine(37)-N6)-methyltransferase [Reichenbachiella]|uniref:tRNA1(Val) (adenine(37)-N6)-methyltransferase n=1 Tax=Reichenbachiella TaxID=156993 RepID=UPI000E6B7B35|nr:methyltransferase [Reichenbachiella sp. MSK19-1]MBU2914425.1 methyltransferase [Reichenbachiella agariperforans]RJE73139.1 hypothetical protein BGP76_04150 [Reichenbachiella sp. MSK19-1]
MANTYFQFKQFTVHQEHCAMKVSTEACILGAWVSKHSAKRILDIGAGTGLVSLMLAQRLGGQIDAVEIDTDAARQTAENFAASPWDDRLSLIQEDVFTYAAEATVSYDLIVSNPPFFTSSLKSPERRNNLAKHDTGQFSKVKFVQCLASLLSEDGEGYVLYPEKEAKEFQKELRTVGLYSYPALIIRNQPNKEVFRVIVCVSRQEIIVSPRELYIRSGQEHTTEFIYLLKDYYLKY